MAREIQNTLAAPAQEGKNWAFWDARGLGAEPSVRDTRARTPCCTPTLRPHTPHPAQGNRALVLSGLGQESGICKHSLHQILPK